MVIFCPCLVVMIVVVVDAVDDAVVIGSSDLGRSEELSETSTQLQG